MDARRSPLSWLRRRKNPRKEGVKRRKEKTANLEEHVDQSLGCLKGWSSLLFHPFTISGIHCRSSWVYPGQVLMTIHLG